MQALYTLDSASSSPAESENSLQQNLDQTSIIFTYLLYFISRVAQYAENDAHTRASRHLRTESDLHVSTRIAGNTLLEKLELDPVFRKKVENDHLGALDDRVIVKKIYADLAATAPYNLYIQLPERTELEERKIISHLFNEVMMKSEQLDQHLEDHYIHWQDDKDMLGQLVNNFLNRPATFNFDELISREKIQYARDLLTTVLGKQAHCLELIRPKLQNWDPDRIAAIDMIIMRMGICELLYFPTIPTKVTINEYIDVAKTYSTPQSGQFVNGILDNILKDLETEGLIHKTNRIK